jgi:protein tyrosine phosphatase (PTP) superfamily phosphohydrolase (DUF442 family)
VITGGLPKEEQLRAAAAEGFRAVVNLVPVDDRAVPDEDVLVQSLGMDYHYIPVVWDQPTAADFAAFERAMQTVGGEPVLIHCAANFRVTAFYSLYAEKHLGWSRGDATAFRASIWDGSDIPVWHDFIRTIEATL